MIGRAAQGRPWFPGQVARYLATGKRERTPPLAEQFTLIDTLYDEMLAHHGWRSAAGTPASISPGRSIPRRPAAGVSLDLLKNHRARVLTAEEPAQARRLLADAYDAFAWRAAA